jgi:hypothetical protein
MEMLRLGTIREIHHNIIQLVARRTLPDTDVIRELLSIITQR